MFSVILIRPLHRLKMGKAVVVNYVIPCTNKNHQGVIWYSKAVNRRLRGGFNGQWRFGA